MQYEHTIQFPNPWGGVSFDVYAEWEEYPSLGNGWDDPGDSGVVSITKIMLNLDEPFNRRYNGVTLIPALWEIKLPNTKQTLLELVEDAMYPIMLESLYDDDSGSFDDDYVFYDCSIGSDD